MRLWSLHPSTLDSKGLVALWREALLAQKVLAGGTRGYTHHPQLHRFRGADDPMESIAHYLHGVHQEATRRRFNFDANKILGQDKIVSIQVNSGQIAYEFKHLLGKLQGRCQEQWNKVRSLNEPLVHPMFEVIPGPVENWEVL